jgi:hypothetical protein
MVYLFQGARQRIWMVKCAPQAPTPERVAMVDKSDINDIR